MNGQIIFGVLICCGFFFGRAFEKAHYRSITKREHQLSHLSITTGRTPSFANDDIDELKLVQGCVVISIDYFKRIVATLISFLGGNLNPYETLLDRARREAILRLKESCPNAAEIVNVRIETSSIYKGSKNQVGSVEVLAYGTAIFKNSQ